jgi:hypothetical protein
MTNVFNSIVASITGEFAFVAEYLKPDLRPVLERPRRERTVKIREFAMPRAGFRPTMRGLK